MIGRVRATRTAAGGLIAALSATLILAGCQPIPAARTGTPLEQPSQTVTLEAPPDVNVEPQQAEAGASPAAVTETPAPGLVANEATLTPWPTRVFTQTRGPSPTKTRTPTSTPTITPTPTPPYAALRINKPGLLSKVVSPIRIEAVVSPGEDGLVRLDLIGEDSRIIAHDELKYANGFNKRYFVATKLDFGISAAAETARLQISTFDLASRPISIASVDLVLLSVGENDLHTPDNLQELYLVRSPAPGATISGGRVVVMGLARPASSKPLVLELVDEQRNIVGFAQIDVPRPRGDLSHTPFSVEIPYTITTSTPVRLVLHQESDGRIPGTVALYSLLLTLEP